MVLGTPTRRSISYRFRGSPRLITPHPLSISNDASASIVLEKYQGLPLPEQATHKPTLLLYFWSLLCLFLATMSLLATFLFVFFSPNLFPVWFVFFASICLVTTAGFVADQLLCYYEISNNKQHLPQSFHHRQTSAGAAMVFKITNSNKGTTARRDKCDTLWASGGAQTHTLAPAELLHCSIATRQWVEQRRITGRPSPRFCLCSL